MGLPLNEKESDQHAKWSMKRNSERFV